MMRSDFSDKLEFSKKEEGYCQLVKYKNGKTEKLIAKTKDELNCKRKEKLNQISEVGNVKQIVKNRNNIDKINMNDLISFVNNYTIYDTFFVKVADLVNFIEKYDNRKIL